MMIKEQQESFMDMALLEFNHYIQSIFKLYYKKIWPVISNSQKTFCICFLTQLRA